MRIDILSLVTILGFAPLAAGEARGQAPPSPTPSVVIGPDWVRKPTGEDVDRLYPPLALFFLIDGQATIECMVAKKGFLADCKVVAEAPTGAGFGAAALAMADRFQMRDPVKITTAAGKTSQSPEGGSVRIPLTFRIPPGRPSAVPPPAIRQASEARRAPAARAAEAEGRYEQVHTALEGYARLFEEASGSAGVPPEVAVEVSASFRRAITGLEPGARREVDDLYAATYTADGLRKREANPRRGDPSVEKAMMVIQSRALLGAALAASAEFCATRGCPRLPPATSAPSSPPSPGPR